MKTSAVGMWEWRPICVFEACQFNGDIGRWDVADMSSMFAGASQFNQDIRRWNVEMVMDMSWMFSDAIQCNGDTWPSGSQHKEDMGSVFQSN